MPHSAVTACSEINALPAGALPAAARASRAYPNYLTSHRHMECDAFMRGGKTKNNPA